MRTPRACPHLGCDPHAPGKCGFKRKHEKGWRPPCVREEAEFADIWLQTLERQQRELDAFNERQDHQRALEGIEAKRARARDKADTWSMATWIIGGLLVAGTILAAHLNNLF